MSSLQTGKAIFNLLNDVQPQKVFPLIADEGTTYPFIIYRRTALLPASSKDRYNYQELVTVEIMVADNTYNGSVKVAELVRTKLENTRGTFNGIVIGDITLIGSEESYLDDAFIQKLIFQIEIQ